MAEQLLMVNPHLRQLLEEIRTDVSFKEVLTQVLEWFKSRYQVSVEEFAEAFSLEAKQASELLSALEAEHYVESVVDYEAVDKYQALHHTLGGTQKADQYLQAEKNLPKSLPVHYRLKN